MIRFIHAADLHIDSPLRGLERYYGAPVERLRSATRSAMEELVDLAERESVDFVLLAGDIYDRDWQDFHTGLFFREQMARLDRLNVPVFMVQGNHDAQGVISRQLTLPDNVTVFSSRKAESVWLENLGVAIHGRSFPDRAVDEDFVPGYPAPVPDCFNIGLLHTSLGGHASHDTYAPTTVASLVEKGYNYWALGHVHVRQVVEQSPRIVFPGNLQGRHANEAGPKGCELVTVNAGSIVSEFVALDVVRWHRLGLSCEGVEDLKSLHKLFKEHVQGVLGGTDERLHAIRVELVGASPLHALEARQPGILEAELRGVTQDLGASDVWLEKVKVEVSATMNRQLAADRDDAVGELVRMVDGYLGDEERLLLLAEAELGSLFGSLPVEIKSNDLPRLDDVAWLRGLMADAESTVLARMSEEGGKA